MQEKYQQYQRAFQEGAVAAGLTQDEANTLEKLCADRQTHTTYAASLAQNQELAKQGNVDLATIGRSRNGNRRIEVCAVGDPRPGGVNGYLQGPGHAPELLATTTTAVLKELMVYHPEIFRRLGYDGMLFCDHIDPDGMALQTWNRRPQTVHSTIYGGYRGAWCDQPAWSYPTASYYLREGAEYHARHPETAASLDILRTYMPYFFGDMHSSTYSSYVVASRSNRTIARAISGILQSYGLQYNADEPESPGVPIVAPGVFGVETRESYARQSPGAAIIRLAPGGTNAAVHLRSNGLMFTPEIASLEALPKKGWPKHLSRRNAIAYRTEHAQRAIAAAALGLERMEPWIERYAEQQSEIRRLRDAAIFWRDFVGQQLAEDLVQANADPDGGRLITQDKFMQLAGTTILNALIAAGNVHRLARAAGDRPTGIMLEEAINPGIDSLRPTRTVPIEHQIASQALVTLTGLRHSLSKSSQ